MEHSSSSILYVKHIKVTIGHNAVQLREDLIDGSVDKPKVSNGANHASLSLAY